VTTRILTGDCRAILSALPTESVHCVVTSPPYWGLRDYRTPPLVWGGEAGCEHEWRMPESYCQLCGAWRGCLGLEPTYHLYVEHMVEVFREVRRVLRPDGLLWLNLGDSYAAERGGTYQGVDTLTAGKNGKTDTGLRINKDRPNGYNPSRFASRSGLKHKDLCGIPWRVAFALQAGGWYLRQDIIWSKPNPMPESVTDRCTKAHEYLFLLTKNARYFFDAQAIKEGTTARRQRRLTAPTEHPKAKLFGEGKNFVDGGISDERNKRSVWTVATRSYRDAHFATFPPNLIIDCIKAGCPEKACAQCGAPWVREVETEYRWHDKWFGDKQNSRHSRGVAGVGYNEPIARRTIGFSPSCSCSCNGPTIPGTVLDPFGGAGTVGLVADRLGRNAIMIELNPDYVSMAERRIEAARMRHQGNLFDGKFDEEAA
jgi:DNA modification methylase